MPLNLTHKLFFIHIPKTAGTSVEIALEMKKPELLYSKTRFNDLLKKSPQHFFYSDVSELFNLKNFDIFTIVRNPFDRIVSEFKYINSAENKYWEPYKNLQFDTFVEKIFNLDIQKRDDLFDWHFTEQYKFIEGAEDKVNIFKYENLKELFNWLNFKTNSKLQFPHERNSSKMHYSFYYKYKKTIDLVSEFYAKDLEKFNYFFEMTSL